MFMQKLLIYIPPAATCLLCCITDTIGAIRPRGKNLGSQR
ncbi:hypothetical protein HMPREF1989_01827 [Porphyromonas gingivalis F0566]|nr:hypothetical protein HMPREF1989_01827 [Porphyromonas gingivalis F0566]